MIVLGSLYYPVYLSLHLHLFAEKHFKYDEDSPTPIDNVRNIYQQIRLSQELNKHGDRLFRELSEYTISFLEK